VSRIFNFFKVWELKTVEGITSRMATMVRELSDMAAAREVLAAAAVAAAQKAYDDAAAHSAEATKASNVAAKIAALVS
jgi:hypothetical protein